MCNPKKTPTNAAKRHLLVYQVLSKNRDPKIETRSNTSSTHSDESLSQDNLGTKKRVEELKKRIRQRQVQIENLHREIDNFHDQEDKQQTLRKEFNQLDRYHKRMIKNNNKVKGFW